MCLCLIAFKYSSLDSATPTALFCHVDDFCQVFEVQWRKKLLSNGGGETIGYWSTEGYEFTESKAVRDRKVVGLALDEDNQSDLSDDRIKTWVTQLKQELNARSDTITARSIQGCDVAFPLT